MSFFNKKQKIILEQAVRDLNLVMGQIPKASLEHSSLAGSVHNILYAWALEDLRNGREVHLDGEGRLCDMEKRIIS